LETNSWFWCFWFWSLLLYNYIRLRVSTPERMLLLSGYKHEIVQTHCSM